MDFPTEIECRVCGTKAPVAKVTHTDHSGKQISWPKVRMEKGGIFVTVECPNCGERPQKIANRDG
jgi:ribosomal protein S27E